MNLAKHRTTTLTSSAAIAAVPCQIHGVLVTGGSAAGVVAIANQATGSGTAVLTVSAPIGGTAFVDLSNMGPIELTVAGYATLSGTGVAATIFWE